MSFVPLHCLRSARWSFPTVSVLRLETPRFLHPKTLREFESPLTHVHCGSLLQAYTNSKSLHRGKELHAYILCSGLLITTRICTKLAAMYAICGDMNHSRMIFNRLDFRSSFLWNVMIRGYACNGFSANALTLYHQMLCDGAPPDNFTFPSLFKACGDLFLLQTGRQIHSQAVICGLEFDNYVRNSLLAMYMVCGQVWTARKLFETMPERTVVSWNIMIGGNFQNGYAEEALMVFEKMRDASVAPDRATVVTVLPVCGQLRDFKSGRRVHEYVNQNCFARHLAVMNSLVDMYAKCGCLEDARKLFDEMSERDVVSWTAMIGGYVLKGLAAEALALSCQMQQLAVRPNSLTMATLLSACANSSSFAHGKCMHGFVIRNRLETDIIVETALIDMYAKCGHVDLSYRLFTMIPSPRRATVPWNAIISGYAQNGLASKAVELFKQMQLEGTRPNSATMIGLLPAHANLADLRLGRNMHCYLIKTGFDLRVEISTALIDVYSKSGSLDCARNLFDRMPGKDIVAWSAIISGYGKHGDGATAILLFDQMLQCGTKPNEITFTSILYACSHAGLVDEGLRLFKSMVENYGMKPSDEHYSCIVDLLGRAGRLKEAHRLIETMPFTPNHAVWGALLGACVIHEDVELGEVAAQWLFKLEPQNTGNYVLLSNIYAALGRWEDAERLRFFMKQRGLMKTPGSSSIEVRARIAATASA